jgi:hypothetical protein
MTETIAPQGYLACTASSVISPVRDRGDAEDAKVE